MRNDKMTVKEFSIEIFQGKPYFEALLESISCKTGYTYAYAKIKRDKTLGAENTVDCSIIRKETLKKIEKFEK